jgi:hypothetical protein
VDGKVIVTVLPVEGLNVYPADATIVAKLGPSVLPWTDSVWVRVLHEQSALTVQSRTSICNMSMELRKYQTFSRTSVRR